MGGSFENLNENKTKLFYCDDCNTQCDIDSIFYCEICYKTFCFSCVYEAKFGFFFKNGKQYIICGECSDQ
jgi:hypothetical protein